VLHRVPLLFAFFLASSWTWCIGMYLPIVLVRDYGIGAWWVFALPNVIGAAAMGWVLSSKSGASKQLTLSHATACWWFSVVTIAFHVFFLAWKFGPAGLIAIVPAVALAMAVKKDVDACVAALLTWVVSVVAVLVIARHYDLAPQRFFNVQGDPTQLLALAAPCVLGFLLCPYLDLTFHRARQGVATNGQSRVAFTLGFGVLFLLMIVFTPMYGALLNTGKASWGWSYGVLVVHILMQAVLTMALHVRSTADAGKGAGKGASAVVVAVILGTLGWGAVLMLQRLDITQYSGLETGEVVYRSFMAFYGLIAPAYVLLVMTQGTPVRRNVIVMTLATVLAMPFYWMGFIERQMPWAIAGVMIVVIARFFTVRSAGVLQNQPDSLKSTA
jgi:hypothetical protein